MKSSGSKSLWGISVSRILGLILTPILIAGVFLWGLWDPTSRMNDVTAAVVNLDEPVEVDGQLTPLGRVLAAELISTNSSENFTWQLTNEEGAAEGLASGKFVTVVTIPENFSKAATSLSDGPSSATQATIEIETSERAKLLDAALSSAVTSTATRVLNEQLGSAFVGNIFVGMTALAGGLGQASDGAKELTSGLDQLAAGLLQLGDGGKELSHGAEQLAEGSHGIAGGLGETAAGAGQLTDGLTTYAMGVSDFFAGTQDFSAGLGQYAAGVDTFAGGSQDLASGAEELAGGVTLYTDTINGVISPINEFLKGLIPQLEELRAAIEAGDLPVTPEQKEQLLELIDQILGVPDDLDEAIEGGETLAAGARELAGGASLLAEGAGGLAAGAHGLTEGAIDISAGAGSLADGAWGLAGGVNELTAGLNQLSDGASTLAGGAGAFAGGLPEFMDGIDQLAEGAGEAANGSQELTSGLNTMVDEIPAYTDDEVSKFAEIAITPVAYAGNGSLFNGSGAPLFVAIALWAGALASFLLLKPLWPRAREAALSEASITLRSAVPSLLLGATQGFLVGLGVALVLSLAPMQTLGFIFAAAVTGASFALINQALVALMGGYGRFISLVVLVAGFVVGIVSTTPAALNAISDFSPIGAGIGGLAAAIDPSRSVVSAILIVLLWAALGFILIGAAVHRRRTKSQ